MLAPAEEAITHAIDALDNQNTTEVFLVWRAHETNRLMTVSGGRDSLVVCSFAEPTAGPGTPTEKWLTSPDRDRKDFDQVVGGIPTPLPACWSVSKGRAKEAALWFNQSGEAHAELEWEEVF